MMTTKNAGLPQSILLLLGSCLPVLGAVLIAPILPQMEAHFQSNRLASVLVPVSLTLPALLIALFSPIVGIIADKFGRKFILLVAMVLYGIFGALPLWLSTLEGIVISRAALGIAEAAIMTCCTTLMGDYYKGRQREQIFALQMVATSLSAVIFITAGGIIGQNSWKTPFWLYTSAFFILPLMAIFFWEPIKQGADQIKTAVIPQKDPFPWNKLTVYFVLSIIMGICLFIVPVQASYMLNLLHVENPSQIGLTMGANQAGILAGAVLFQWLPSSKRVAILQIGFFIIAVGCVLMGMAAQHMTLTFAVTLIGIGVGLLMPTLITSIMSFVSYDQRGRAAGIFTSALFLGEFLSPIFVLSVTKGNPELIEQALYLIAGALVAIICVTLFRIIKVHPPIIAEEKTI